MKYTNALLEKAYFDERPVLRARTATVEMSARSILVEWMEGSREFRYEGVRTGQGHFILRGDGGVGEATLHRFQYSTILEGFWKRNSRSGFWRIHLPGETVADVIQLPRPKPSVLAAAKRSKPLRRFRVSA